jgi:tetratricopeptide (TPR) repeat protein
MAFECLSDVVLLVDSAAAGQTANPFLFAVNWFTTMTWSIILLLFLLSCSMPCSAALAGLPQVGPSKAASSVTTRNSELKRASELIAAHRLIEAESTLNGLLQQNKNDAEAMNLLGVVRGQQEKKEEAEILFRNALVAEPTLASAHANLGLLYLQEDRPEQSMDEYEAALKIDPFLKEATTGMVGVAEQQALAARKSGDLEKGLSILIRARKSLPAEPRLLYDFGMLAILMKLYEDGAQALEQALKLEPDAPDTIYALARARLEQQKMAEAERLMREYLKLRPDDPTAHYGLGRVLSIQLQTDAARAEFERSVDLQPQQTESYYELGQLELDARHDDKALELFEKVLARNPKHGGALTGAGIVAYRRKDYAKAEEYLAGAVANVPDFVTAHYYYGLALGHLGRKSESEKELAVASQMSDAQDQEKHRGLKLVSPDTKP